MTELKATNHGEQEDGTGVQATGLDALLDGLFEPEPWVAEGACRGMTEVFFSDEPGDIEQAKRICATCPVIEPCLEAAIAFPEPWGVWGGQLFRNGHILAVKRRRGRPSKASQAALQLTKEDRHVV
jgi:WhiB family redox-sensing transcriptional regulator